MIEPTPRAPDLEAGLAEIDRRLREIQEELSGTEPGSDGPARPAVRRTGRSGPLEAALQRAIALKPEDALSYLYLAASLIWPDGTQGQLQNQKKLELALTIWQEGASYGIPTSHTEWSFLIRSLTLQSLASTLQAQPARAASLNWEEAYYLERTILLSLDNNTSLLTSENEKYWSLLGFCYMLLERPTTALETSPEEQNQLDLAGFRATTLAAIEDRHAADAIEHYHQQLEQNPSPELMVGIEVVLSWYLYLTDNLQEASKWLDACIVTDENVLTSWLLRGHIYRKMGNRAQADADYQHIWEVTAPGQPLAIPENMLTRANAGFELTHYRDAIDILQQCLEDPVSDLFDIYITLAFCYLAIQNIHEARQAIQDALIYLKGRALQVHASLMDLSALEQFHLGGQAHTEAVQEVITPYREVLQKKYQQASEQTRHDRGATKELLQPLEQGEFEAGTFPWLASLAGAARIALRTQQLSQAILYYQILLQYDTESKKSLFPEARWGLVRALSRMSAKLACAGEVEEALVPLRHAIQLCIEDMQNNSLRKVVQEVHGQIQSPQQFQAIAEVLHLITADPSIEAQQRQELIIAQLRLSKETYQQYYVLPSSITEADTQKLAPQFVADKYIALELGFELIEENLIQEHIIDTGIPAMRDRIRQNMGVIIPGIQLRDNLDLPLNDYEIVFYNGMRVRGTISMTYSSSFMRDAYTSILSHLEAAINDNLDILLGIQEVQFTLDEWKREQEEERSILLKEVLPDAVTVARFAQVLRSLIKERLPIVDLDRILRAFKSIGEREISDAIHYVAGKLRQEPSENARLDD